MDWLPKIRNLFRALFAKRNLDVEMNEEMRSHVEMQTQENIDAGMNPQEARCAAMREFGRTESIKEECREQRGMTWVLPRDSLSHAIRIIVWATARR